MVTVRVRTDDVIGAVNPLLYGHFTEHLATVIYDGLWSELLFGRKFESPMVGREHTMCEPWEPFAGKTDALYLRAPGPLARHASPQAEAHHAQGVVTGPETGSGERGLAQRRVPIDGGTTYRFRGNVRRVGPAGTLRVAIRASDGVSVLADAHIEVPEVTETRFGDDFPHNALWMDDISWREIDADLTVDSDEADAVFTLTFESEPGENCLWMFDWVSLMPADNLGGWHRGVVEALQELPAQSLKWPGGCMADDYDWRYGLGDRDRRFGTVDQAWATWDENDVGIDEFMELCRLTDSEPVLGVNGGNGSPEMAAQFVEYCNGSADTEWGARRAANGHPEPYDVRYWVVGNEQWGFFETGYVGAAKYAERYLAIARAMKNVDASINLTAVGQVGEFNRTVLQQAAGELDMLQIHAYTPELGIEVTDAESATKKIASAQFFDVLLDKVREDIASVDDAGHVLLNVDEWGWGRAGHTGAIFMAGGLNAFQRAGELVQIGSKAAVINVDAVLERLGEQVVRTSAYDVFRLFNEGHLENAVRVETEGPDAEQLDVSALAGDGKVSVFIVNRASEPTPVSVVAAEATADLPVTVRSVVAASDDLTGPSRLVSNTGKLNDVTSLPPHSLTLVQIGS